MRQPSEHPLIGHMIKLCIVSCMVCSVHSEVNDQLIQETSLVIFADSNGPFLSPVYLQLLTLIPVNYRNLVCLSIFWSQVKFQLRPIVWQQNRGWLRKLCNSNKGKFTALTIADYRFAGVAQAIGARLLKPFQIKASKECSGCIHRWCIAAEVVKGRKLGSENPYFHGRLKTANVVIWSSAFLDALSCFNVYLDQVRPLLPYSKTK